MPRQLSGPSNSSSRIVEEGSRILLVDVEIIVVTDELPKRPRKCRVPSPGKHPCDGSAAGQTWTRAHAGIRAAGTFVYITMRSIWSFRFVWLSFPPCSLVFLFAVFRGQWHFACWH